MPRTKLNPITLAGSTGVEEVKWLCNLTGFEQTWAYLEHYFLNDGWRVLEQLEFDRTLYKRIIDFDRNFKIPGLCTGKSYVTIVILAIKAALEGANYHSELSNLMCECMDYSHWIDQLFSEHRVNMRIDLELDEVRSNVTYNPVVLTKFNEEFQKLINHE